MTASAWDIAGAVVWTPLGFIHAVIWWQNVSNPNTRERDVIITCCLSTPMALAASYCIARLMGAHA